MKNLKFSSNKAMHLSLGLLRILCTLNVISYDESVQVSWVINQRFYIDRYAEDMISAHIKDPT